MKRAILIHGFGSTGLKGWRVPLKAALEQKGYQVFVPDMPNTNHPKQEEWVAKIQELIQNPDGEEILIGHSLGNIAILRYLETLSDGQKISKALLVAPFDNDLGNADIGTFYKTKMDWETYKKRCENYFCLFSDNDKYVSIENEKVFKENLNADTLLMHNMGHFSHEEGCNDLPILLEKI